MSQDQWNPFLKTKAPERKVPTMGDLDPIVCPKCGNSVFDRYYKMYTMKKKSPDMPKLFHIPIFVCANCAEILDTKEEPDNSKSLIEGAK